MTELLLILPVLLFSVVLHEYAHGWMALRQGDTTALARGRLTLNPIPHIDAFGSIIVPLLLWLAPGQFLFGWAKPVPVNPRNFRDYRRGDILVSLAGVGANLLLAAAFTAAAILLVHVGRFSEAAAPTVEILIALARLGVWLNLILAFFNLIPIPPLDGSHVVYHLLPPRLGVRYQELGRYGLLVLMALLFLAPGAFQLLLWPVGFLGDLADALIRLWT